METRKLALLALFFGLPFLLVAQRTITGTVSDAETGEPLIGANILVMGTSTGTITDFDGTYTLEVPEGQEELRFSYTGYQEQTLTLGPSNIVNVEMVSGEMLDEVVVIGYGVQRKRDVAGAISKVDNEELTALPAPSFDAALQGKATGVQIITGSGNAGSGSLMRIRGIGSVSAGGDPLFVIDGVPMTNDPFLVGGEGDRSAQQYNPLATLNPSDIESVEILKDAGSAGIYGSRGANGVVIITTKRGAEGTSRIDFTTRLGTVEPTLKPAFVNRDEWLQLRQEAWENDGGTGLAWLPNFSTPDQNAEQRAAAWDEALQNNTDWWDLLTHTGFNQEYNLSYTQGSERMNTYASLAYSDQESYLVNNSFQRLSARLNFDIKATEKLDINILANYSRGLDRRVRNAWEGGLGAAMSTALPIYPVRDETGDYFRYNSSANGGNPLIELENQDWRVRENRFLGNLGLTYQLNENIVLNGRFGADYIDLVEDKFFPGEVFDLNQGWGTAERDFKQVGNYTGNLTANYLRDYNSGSLNVLLGVEYQKSRVTGDFYRYRGPDVLNPGYEEEDEDALDQQSPLEPQNFSFGSAFSRIIYTWKGKYIFNVLARADGSSKFGPNNRIGFFPAVSVAWLMSDEPFMYDLDFISYMKLRASYGLTGNAAGIPDYRWLRRYDPVGTRVEEYNGVSPIGLRESGNPDLKWETIRNLDIGMEINFFRDRIRTEIAYYNKTTQDALVQLQGVPSNGLTGFWDNILKIRNEGVELTLATDNLVGEFTWTTELNMARNDNKVLDLGGLSPDAIGGGTNDTRILEGLPVGTNFLIRYHGVDPDDGAPIWVDRDGYLTKEFDLENRVPVGSVVPDLVGGFRNSFGYKGFSLDVNFVFTIGGNIYDNSGKRQLGVVTDWQMREEIADRWTPENRDAYYPRLTVDEQGYEGLSNAWQYNSTMFLYDASYLRLRNLTLGYTFSPDFLEGSFIRNLGVNLTATNLLTWTEFPLDPEIARDFENAADRNLSPNVTYLTAPQAKTFTVALRASF